MMKGGGAMPSEKAVIFDLDGVLIDSEELHYAAYQRVLAQFGVNVGREEYARHWIAAGHGPEYAIAAYRLPVTADQLRDLKNPVYHELLRNHVQLMPGAVEALERLARAYPLALATNSNAVDVGFVVDRFGLRRFFRAIVTREQYARPKPDPDAFLAAAAAIGVPPHRCAVVEDAYKGVLAAHRAGMPCVVVPHAFTADNDFRLAARRLASLDELTAEVVEQLLRR